MRRSCGELQAIRGVTPKLRILLGTLLVTVPSDQLSKLWVAAHVGSAGTADRIAVIEDFFYLTHVRNPGAAFGLLRDWPDSWRLAVFSLVAVITITVVVSFYRSLEAYKQTFKDKNDVMVIDPSSAFFKYLKSTGKGGK